MTAAIEAAHPPGAAGVGPGPEPLTSALAGSAIVVTRPLAQAMTLASAIRERGGEPVLFPTIEIRDTPDVDALDQTLSRLNEYVWAFFVSPNAVEKTMVRVRDWPPSLRVGAIGPGTQAALRLHGINDVVTPTQRFDSEGLMALPQFAAVQGLRCVIFRGNGGRELIATTMTERGAVVDVVECYRRDIPAIDATPLIARACAGTGGAGSISALTFTSSEGARNFVHLIGPTVLSVFGRTPVFVPHARIALAARRLGFEDVVETGAADEGLVAALIARFSARYTGV